MIATIKRSSRKPRLLIPEVVQTSSMDCGPASLKCLLGGFGISVNYGRLREACQTDVDGTSINTLEELAMQFGLDAEQVMIPVDHLLLMGAQSLPAIVVTRLPNGINHFVVAWRRHGRLLQVMDPATGRRWPSCERFERETYVHVLPVRAESWSRWARTEEFVGPLQDRLRRLGLTSANSAETIRTADRQPGWRSMASLDAATRMVTSIVDSGGLERGRQAGRALRTFVELACDDDVPAHLRVPVGYWSARPAPKEAGVEDETLLLQGAVLVRARRRIRVTKEAPTQDTPGSRLSSELAAALEERAPQPWREILRFLGEDGLLAPVAVALALLIAASGVALEALLFRGLIDIARDLGLPEQRLGAIGAFVVFLIAFVLLEIPLFSSIRRLGRGLEGRLRMAFLDKIPKVGDRYFNTRLRSDMAERTHSVHALRQVPVVGSQLIRSVFALSFTTVGIIWLDPTMAPIVGLAALVSVALPLALQPVLSERDLRVRTHGGALSRFYLDGLLGLIPVRAHGAERVVEREHESLLMEWTAAALRLQRTVVGVDGLLTLVGIGLSIWLVLAHLGGSPEIGGVLLLIYWALSMPSLGQDVALMARQYPGLRNVTHRLLEPLEALEEQAGEDGHAAPGGSESSRDDRVRGDESRQAVSVRLRDATIRSGGHTILTGVNLHIEAGCHVAIVGPSGAGKTTLVGTLLGWYRPSGGEVRVNDLPLSGKRLESLREETAWVDPTVQLWNRPLIDNLLYGSRRDWNHTVARVLEEAELRPILEGLPRGMQTRLGEGGALVSGGEGQRVRFGRALHRAGIKLAILDEPFRGLDRELRKRLLARARRHWDKATMLCVTHDIGETITFDRVVVVRDGRIVETGIPEDLSGDPKSEYRALLDAEEVVRTGLWSRKGWRRLRMERGRLTESVRTGES